MDQIKKNLELYNFSEEDTDLSKVYAYNQELNQISIKIFSSENSENITQKAYLIKMLDVFFAEKLKLENYAIKLSSSNLQEYNQSQDELTKLLQILSVSYVINPKLTLNPEAIIEFVSRDLGTQNIFATGGHNTKNIQAEINLSQLITLVKKNQSKLLIPEKRTLHVVVPATKEQDTLALLLADRLQSNFLSTDIILDHTENSEALVKANKFGAKYVLIIGADEQKNGTVTIKNMYNGHSAYIKQTELISYLT